jgi:hypothetical protein
MSVGSFRGSRVSKYLRSYSIHLIVQYLMDILCVAFQSNVMHLNFLADPINMVDESRQVPASCSHTDHPIAWRNCAPAVCSLKDIMSETLANELHLKEMDTCFGYVQLTFLYFGIRCK